MWRPISNSLLLQQCQQRRYTFITVVALAVLILAFFIAFASFSDNPPALPTLKLVHVVFRHGDRTPTASYPTDPNKDHKWLGGPGSLTNRGKTRLYKVGEVMRYRYDKFLGDIYDPDEIYVESSHAPRCQMSAQLFMAGLFPPKGAQIWNQDLKWQPIPVNPIPRALDNKIAAKKKCNAFDIAKRKSDEEINSNLSKQDKQVLEILSQHTGLNVTTISQAEALYYTLRLQNENDLDLPGWVSPIFPIRLAELAGLNLASYTYNDELKKFQAGPMLKEWVLGMKERKLIPKKKAHFYSAHDLTIVSLARALGFHELDIPYYGDCLIVEYHEADDNPGNGFVQAWYFRESGGFPKFDQFQLPFCAFDCPIQEFANYLQKYINWKDWDAECGNK